MKKNICFFIILLLCVSCGKKTDSAMPDPSGMEPLWEDAQLKIEFTNFDISTDARTIRTDIKFTDRNKKVNLNNLDIEHFRVKETGTAIPEYPNIDSLIDIRGQKKISDDYSILLLVDRSASVSELMLQKQKEAIRALIEEIPGADIYISFMDGSVTRSTPVRIDNFDTYNWERSQNEKLLYKAILSKIRELYGLEPVEYSEIPQNPALQDTSHKKMLFILTDGKIKTKHSFLGGDDFFVWKDELLNEFPDRIERSNLPAIPIHCIYFGEKDQIPEIENEMEVICYMGETNETRGKFHRDFQIDSLKNILLGTIDSIAADYRLVMSNPPGKIYKGQELTLRLGFQKGMVTASGSRAYSLGSPMNPVVVPELGKAVSKWHTIVKGLIGGVIFLLIVYVLLQFLVPYIQYRIFLKRYVKSYKSGGSGGNLISQKCYHCKEEFLPGDKIVTKCRHTVHWECWEENRNRCPEYGSKNCDTGKHYYNKTDKTDAKNAPYFLSWMLYGMLGGLLTWICYKLFYTADTFAGLTGKLVNAFYPADNVTDLYQVGMHFQSKISGLLLGGILLGAFLTFLFSYIIEFRKKDLKTLGFILLRSLVGAVFGFLSFLLGAIIFILLGKDTNCFWVDWIPWLFFGCSIAWLISFKTEINPKNALLGGLLSVLLSFVVLYFGTFAGEIAALFSFMIYGAGLGVAIAVVHFASEKYFLRVEGPVKEREIAIYKWMSGSGGFNRVTIGKSMDSVLEMNWDTDSSIADKQLALYIENERPFMEALEDGTLINGNRELKKGQRVNLSHGTEFKVGKTTFTYIEKDK